MAFDGYMEPVVAVFVVFPDQFVELVVVEDVEEVFSASGKVLDFGTIRCKFGRESDVGSITVEVVAVGSSFDGFIQGWTTVARGDDYGFVEVFA